MLNSRKGALIGALAASLLLGAFHDVAHAGAMTISFGTHSQDVGYGHGGEFKVTQFEGSYASNLLSSKVTQDDARSLFNTFCLERDENLGGIASYSLSTTAQDGGVNTNSGDPLGDATARLYYAFWADAWTNGVDYNYDDVGGTRIDDAADLQLAIWFLEGEVASTALTSGAQTFVNFANTVTWQNLGQNWTGTGGVYVVNTFDANGAQKQDQLVVVPLPPAALTGLALLAGVGLIGSLRRRRRS